jgi:pentatricopeptide repeat protein
VSLLLNSKLKPPWIGKELPAAAAAAAVVDNDSSSSVQSDDDISLWNSSRLARYVKAGQYRKAVECFQQMQQQHKGMVPDRFAYVQVLNACARLRALEEGKHIHAQLVQRDCESDIYLGNSLIDMYAKCGSIEDAWKVFNGMQTRNVVTWSAMIMGCAKCWQGWKALALFQQMQEEDVEPNSVTFVGVLNACASVAALEDGRRVHEQILRSGCESNVFVGSSLINMYVKCGSIEDAWRVFKRIPRPDLVCWNSVILGFGRYGQAEKALEVFQQMQCKGVQPVPVTFVAALNACASLGVLKVGQHLHTQIVQNGFQSNVFVGNSLIDMYAKCGSIEDAWRVFNRMPTRDVISWNTMIVGCVNCGQGEKALQLYQQLQSEGMLQADSVTFVGAFNACASIGALEQGRRIHLQTIQSGCESDVFVGSSLLNMYAKCGSIEDARKVFDRMPIRDVVAWNAMIVGYVKCGLEQEALVLSDKMQQEGVEPNHVTFVWILNACASIGALEEGRHIEEQIIHSGYQSDVFLSTSLIDMYAKCGSIDNAWRVFNKMPSRTVVAWNAMILGLVRCGKGEMALELFQQMQQEEGLEPDPISFVGALNACASIAALAEGRNIEKQIIHHGCESDVFVGNSLVDMYAKCGSIDDAWRVFSSMTILDVVSWTAMLQGYGMHGHGKEALRHFEWMCEEGVAIDTVTFVCLLSACNHADLVHEGMHCFESMGLVYGICATVDHYACMVDLLSRAGHVHEAEDLMALISCQPNASLCISLVSSCRNHDDDLGMEDCPAAKQVLKPKPADAMGYTVAGKWDVDTVYES